MKKYSYLVSLMIVCALVSACASSTVNTAIEGIQASDTAYGMVTAIESADTRYNRTACETLAKVPDWKVICDHLNDYEGAKATVLYSSRFVESYTVVPKSWGVRKGAIVQFSPRQSNLAVRIAANQPTSTCGWSGRSHPIESNSAGAVVTGFALGLAIVPAVAMAADESILQGGVICNGWSYQNLVRKG